MKKAGEQIVKNHFISLTTTLDCLALACDTKGPNVKQTFSYDIFRNVIKNDRAYGIFRTLTILMRMKSKIFRQCLFCRKLTTGHTKPSRTRLFTPGQTKSIVGLHLILFYCLQKTCLLTPGHTNPKRTEATEAKRTEAATRI